MYNIYKKNPKYKRFDWLSNINQHTKLTYQNNHTKIIKKNKTKQKIHNIQAWNILTL